MDRAGDRGRRGARVPLDDLVAGHRSSGWSAGMAFKTDVYEVDGHMIWGATARILGDLLTGQEPTTARPRRDPVLVQRVAVEHLERDLPGLGARPGDRLALGHSLEDHAAHAACPRASPTASAAARRAGRPGSCRSASRRSSRRAARPSASRSGPGRRRGSAPASAIAAVFASRVVPRTAWPAAGSSRARARPRHRTGRSGPVPPRVVAHDVQLDLLLGPFGLAAAAPPLVLGREHLGGVIELTGSASSCGERVGFQSRTSSAERLGEGSEQDRRKHQERDQIHRKRW